MIEIRIPKEINDYKEKLFLGLTLRQTLSIVLLVIINVPAYFGMNETFGSDVTTWFILLNAVPIVVVGFVRPNGMEFEKFAVAFLQTSVLFQQNRPYITENLYEEIANIVQKEKDDRAQAAYLAEKALEIARREEEKRGGKAKQESKTRAPKAQEPKAPKVKEKRVKKEKPDREFVGAHLRK
ncbi:MAG: PrgI family protein [Clostridiales bacterium]|jgi:hypothetical protein|nr:PrgI family protein [Clostridiales bacterium]